MRYAVTAVESTETPVKMEVEILQGAVVPTLLEASADANAQTPFGCTALMTAAAHNHPEAIALLLEASADVDAETQAGFTALMSAAACGADKCVELLLDARANTELQNENGDTALSVAQIRGCASTQLLLQRACAAPASPAASLPKDAVVIRTKDGRRFQVPASSLQRAGVTETESRRARRSLNRASGLLARDMHVRG